MEIQKNRLKNRIKLQKLKDLQTKIQEQLKKQKSKFQINLDNSPQIWKYFITKNYVDNSFVKTLFLSNCRIKDSEIRIITNADFKELIHFQLFNNKITKIGLINLVVNYNWGNLHNLNLTKNKIGNSSLKYLCKTTVFINLVCLQLSQCHIGDAGLVNLSKLKAVKLKNLHLYNNFYTLSGVQIIASFHSFQQDVFIGIQIGNYIHQILLTAILKFSRFLEQKSLNKKKSLLSKF